MICTFLLFQMYCSRTRSLVLVQHKAHRVEPPSREPPLTCRVVGGTPAWLVEHSINRTVPGVGRVPGGVVPVLLVCAYQGESSYRTCTVRVRVQRPTSTTTVHLCYLYSTTTVHLYTSVRFCSPKPCKYYGTPWVHSYYCTQYGIVPYYYYEYKIWKSRNVLNT